MHAKSVRNLGKGRTEALISLCTDGGTIGREGNGSAGDEGMAAGGAEKGALGRGAAV